MLEHFHAFYEDIEPKLPSGVPEPALMKAIRDGAIEMYREVGWVKAYVPNNLALVTGKVTYEITSPVPEMAFFDIEKMESNGRPVAKKERLWMDEHYQGWETKTAAQPEYYIPLDWNDARYQFQVYPIASEDSTSGNNTSLVIRGLLCPTRITDRLDGSAYYSMIDGVVACALRRLYEQNGMPWFNRAEAAFQNEVALKNKDHLRIEAEFGMGRSVPIAQTYGGFPHKFD